MLLSDPNRIAKLKEAASLLETGFSEEELDVLLHIKDHYFGHCGCSGCIAQRVEIRKEFLDTLAGVQTLDDDHEGGEVE